MHGGAVKTRQIVFFALSVALILLSACSGGASANGKGAVTPIATSPNSSVKNGYLYVNSANTAAVFLQFTDQNGNIVGTGTETYISTSQGIASIAPLTFTFSGTHVGDTVTLTFTFPTGTKTYMGTFKDNTLTLTVTQSDGSIQNIPYYAASIDEYNQAVATMKQKVQSQNQAYTDTQNAQATATAMANKQNTVQNDNNRLANALSTLKSDSTTLSQVSYTNTLDSYSHDWAQMQKDYSTEQADAAKGCGDGGVNLGYVQTDDGYVQTDNGYIQTDDGYLQTDKGYYDNALSSVETDIKNVNGWWAQLQADAADNPTHTPAPAYTADQINQAIADAQGVETAALNAWNSAYSLALGYDGKAADLLKKADAIPAGMHC